MLETGTMPNPPSPPTPSRAVIPSVAPTTLPSPLSLPSPSTLPCPRPPSPPPPPPAHPTTSRPTTFPLFARLPPELRSSIYQLALVASSPRRIHTLAPVAGSDGDPLAVVVAAAGPAAVTGLAGVTSEARAETARACARLPTRRLTYAGALDWREPMETAPVAPRLYPWGVSRMRTLLARGDDEDVGAGWEQGRGRIVVWWLTAVALNALVGTDGWVAWEGDDDNDDDDEAEERLLSPRIPWLATVMVSDQQLLIYTRNRLDHRVGWPFILWPNLWQLVVGFFSGWLTVHKVAMIEGLYDELVAEIEVLAPPVKRAAESPDDDGKAWEDAIEDAGELEIVGLEAVLPPREISPMERRIQEAVMDSRYSVRALREKGIEVVWAVFREESEGIIRNDVLEPWGFDRLVLPRDGSG